VSRKALLLRIGVSWAAAGVLLAAARPPEVGHSWPLTLAAGVGLVAGAALYTTLARRPPRPTALPPVLALVLVVGAGAEEVLWRWFALCELASRIGVVLAIGLTSVTFAGVHRNRNLGHVLAGGVFGAVFVVGGTVVAAWAAHAAYNLLVAGSARARVPSLAFSDTGTGRVRE